MTHATVLRSQEDASVNFITESPDKGLWESRYVRRTPDYFIAYLSSHTGCSQSCRFCHLTATGQTMFTPATPERYRSQAEPIFAHYDMVTEGGMPQASRVNVNFMARGEPLANPYLVSDFASTRALLTPLATERNLAIKFNVSSILPKSLLDTDRPLFDILGGAPTMLYYSLYSMRPEFRRRWLPKAMEPNVALDMIADYQKSTGELITLHWAFIKGENDDLATIDEIIDAVTSRGIRAKFNLVRYNPYSPLQGTEPEDAILQRNFDRMQQAFSHPKTRIVPRVGFDVKASCGMFIEGPGTNQNLVRRAQECKTKTHPESN